ncbi:Actin filament-associated protein 1 [Acropora cervicornis]|uniref:Actin filament-associated protein 1 n=1 Tax=Acropora cervicornis TaxID=6130 RepID=A0AAD9Q9X7_ACRCE|nr:Actin filament-associated protein 1 [Acropora cervicornis]
MDKHDRFIAINQTLPGLEDFLRVVLGGERLSEEANRQRIELLRRLESVSKPPSLPPRPANLGEIYRSRVQQNNDAILSGSQVQDDGSPYLNDKTLDPVEFASQQRELSRVSNFYKTYAPQTVILGEKGSKNSGSYLPRSGISTHSRDNIRDSIQSSSSVEDDIYERLSIKSLSPSVVASLPYGDTDIKNEDSFIFPSPPKTPQEGTGTGIYIGTRSGSFRASAGKGKLSTGWFKKEAKVLEEVYASNLQEPVMKGYLKDTKVNKRRWCVLQGNRLHIFKTHEDPAIMIIDLLGCEMGVDDKKKISHSFKLTPKEGPGVTLAIEDGQDLSPWMSAIMAAVVRRGSIERPSRPLDSAFSLKQTLTDKAKDVEEEENYYEVPVDFPDGGAPFHSTFILMESDDDEDQGYDVPLPPLPIIDDYSSSESSSDEDESIERKEPCEKTLVKKKIDDAVPADLLAELTAGKSSVASYANQSQDSVCEDVSTNEHSLDFTDSHSEHSGNISNRHSYSEPLASDDTGSSEPKAEKTGSLTRKRTSTVLSAASMDSVCSDNEQIRRPSQSSEASVSYKGLAPKVKRRRKLVPAEAEHQFLQDPDAMHSGILHQKRRLGVWSKRYCKIIESRFLCYRNPADLKPSLDLPILGYEVNLTDIKESKKSYCMKISHPSNETHYFATDSRVSIERWIEVLSLAATGRVDVIPPYAPYYCAEQSGDELKSRSQESFLSSEGRLSDDDSADTLDDLDGPAESNTNLKTSEEQRSLASANSDMVLSGEARQTNPQEVQPPLGNELIDRMQKKRRVTRGNLEGTKTPSTMSPPHSMFISESVDGQAKPEPIDQEPASHAQTTPKHETSEDSSTKRDKRWKETLRRKKLSRAMTYDPRLRSDATTSNLTETSKNKHQSMRRKNSQTITHLLNLFDKEGRFSGYLTEVKANKFGTTHLRRWCVVKNGLLILYNSECEETPQAKLSLVDMWLTDKSNESRNKFAFTLEDKEGKETILQTTTKEDYQKWLGVLELFTELRVERPTLDVAADSSCMLESSVLESSAGEEGDGNFQRGTLRSKSARAASKLKGEISALAPSKVRSSLRMKLSHRVNVRDIFRKAHNSYDLEGAPTEGASSTLPDTDVDTVAVFGGLLTQVKSNASGVDTVKSRWCTIKEKELLVFSDHKAADPLLKIPLDNSVFSNLSQNEGNVHRFQVRHGNEKIVFETCDKFDLNRWLRMLASVTEYRNSSDDERPKCTGRLTSPTFAKKKILHRRTRSEALSSEEATCKPESRTQWYTGTKEGSSSATDRLVSGYMQEVRESHGARTMLRRWCVATSDKFCVYDNQNSNKASYEWQLSEMMVQDQSDIEAGTFGFYVAFGEEKLCFRVIDEDSARRWLSVLVRYCHAVPSDQPLFKTSSSKWRSNGRRASSDNDLKNAELKSPDKETKALEVLSEGRASGRKLTRRATEDSTFFRKFNRPEFKAPWRASSEKLEVKMRERSGRTAANRVWKRFSSGSLFDSEGKYSGHLMEMITSELYSSQVRRWCLQKDDLLQVFENEACDKPIKTIPLFDVKVTDTSDLDACFYRFRIDYGDNQSVFFRALTRSDLEKWTTVISVKTAVLQDRSERQFRRSRTLISQSSTNDLSESSESDVASPDINSSKHLAPNSYPPQSPVSICSQDSVFMRSNSTGEETTSSTRLKQVEPVKESNPSIFEQENEQFTSKECERTAVESRSSEPQEFKTRSRLSSIADLSELYENFMTFASVMSESNSELKDPPYHVYENVSRMFDFGSQELSRSEDKEQGDKVPALNGEEIMTGNELASPSSEINSAFEKISLGDREGKQIMFRYSGIHRESGLDQFNEVIAETTLAESAHGVGVQKDDNQGLSNNAKSDLNELCGKYCETEEANAEVKKDEDSVNTKQSGLGKNLTEISTNAKAAHNKQSSSSVGFESAVDEDQMTAGDIEDQIQSSPRVDFPNTSQPDLAAVNASVEQDSVSETRGSYRKTVSCEKDVGRAFQNVGKAEAFETSFPPVSTCSRKLEVHSEHAVQSAVSKSDHVQVSHAVTHIRPKFRETMNSESLKGNSPFVEDNCRSPESGVLDATFASTSDKEISDCASNRSDNNQFNSHLKHESRSGCTETNEVHVRGSNPWDSSHSDAEEAQSSDTYLNSTLRLSGSLEANLLQKESFNDSGTTSEQSSMCVNKCSSDKEHSTPECTFVGSGEKINDKQNALIDAESEVSTSECDHQLDIQRETFPTIQRFREDTVSNIETITERESRRSRSPHSADQQEIRKSQLDMLKAVTAAFEEILELHGDDSDADNTKL